MSAEVKSGYKLTEVGVIPEDWEVKPLAAVVSYTNGKAHEQSITDSGNFVVVNSKFISTEGFTRKYCQECFCPTVKGDVLMVMSDVPNGRAIAKCFWVDSDRTYTVNQRICVLNPKGIDGELLYYKLDRNPFYLAFDDGAKQTNLRREDVLSCPLALPNSEIEQRAIAEALSDVDALLDRLVRLLTKKRNIKQAAMQRLLTGKTRLPGFSGEWEVKRLGELGSTFGGLTGKTKADFGDGSGQYVTFMNVMTNVVIDCNTFDRVRIAPSESQNQVMKGDLLFNGSSETPEEVAMCALLNADVPNLFLNSFCFGFRFHNATETDGLFLTYYIRSKEGREVMKSLAQGSTRYNLSKAALLRASLRLPARTEQTAIAAALSDMDAELAALEKRRDKTRNLKQAMMQELLTGKIRLI